MAFLFIVFAIAMGLGTFIEHWYNTTTAFKYIYDAWWFEAILLLFCINFIGNIKRYNLTSRKKWPLLLIHISLIVILVGAFFTRYTGYEGLMSIREGETSNLVVSKKTYLKAVVEDVTKETYNKLTIHKPILLSVRGNNDIGINESLNSIPFQIDVEDYVINAEERIQADPGGDYYLKITFAHDNQSDSFFLKNGDVRLIDDQLIAFNSDIKNAINIRKEGESYYINSPVAGSITRMSDERQEVLTKDAIERIRFQWLYQLGDMQIVFQKFNYKGTLAYLSKSYSEDDALPDLLTLNITSDQVSKEITVRGNKGVIGEPKTVKVGDLVFTLSFGSKPIYLPYKIKLNDFKAEKYPGTQNSYSSFESQVTVLAKEDTLNRRIYMNNVLDYQGYRFFQASFHPDEKGTILSVNHDKTGTRITYSGYLLLYISLLFVLLSKRSRFGIVRRKLRNLRKAKFLIVVFILAAISVPTSCFAQLFNDQNLNKDTADSLIAIHEINHEHAAKFGELVIQDGNGRMKPINTFSSELLRKVHDNNFYNALTSDQVFLSMLQYPELWYEAPIIKLKENNKLTEILNLEPGTQFVSLSDLFYENGSYRLISYLSDAYSAFIPNNFQESVIDLDRKSNLLNFALKGNALRIFPIPDDRFNKWVSFNELEQANIKSADSLFTKTILPLYVSSLIVAETVKDYEQPNILLNKIEAYQIEHGKSVRPNQGKIYTEVFYNRINIFEKLRTWYLISGLLLILFSIITIIYDQNWLRKCLSFIKYTILLLFLFHTVGIAVRWYISGHAPWSDAYESMIYVSWATLLFGIIIGKRSYLTLGATSFITSIILVVAHWNWMDPAIANLQPVLNSYWLMIHVAIIVASYGPFTLGMILGLIILFFMAFANNKNKTIIKMKVAELVYISELALTIGLIMLVIGNFLGGQWANESWGRYWGWDPKETWALISIMIYAFVIHMRIVPNLKGKWLFSLMSVLAYFSILMTYFGVNFYLTGLHSYANGDKIVTPHFIYYSILAIAVLAFFAYLKDKKYLRNGLYNTL